MSEMFGQKATSLLTRKFINDDSIWHVLSATYLMHENKYIHTYVLVFLYFQLRGVDRESVPAGKQTQPQDVSPSADSASTTCNIPHSPFMKHGFLSVGPKLTANIAC
jgi:hypothetical protein